MVKRIPCLKINEDAPPCHLRVFPTKEEAEAEDAAFEAHIADFMKHMPIACNRIIEIARETNASAGVIDCPKCGGSLHWSRARSNGHVHAKCETADCLGWME
jgi:hypothetical protein